MPAHPDVLHTLLTDAVDEFERCRHTIRETISLENNRVLSREYEGFTVEAKQTVADAKLMLTQGQTTRELVGEDRQRALQEWQQHSYKMETTLLAQVGERTLRLGGASLSLALYHHRATQELWVGKSDVLDGGNLSKLGVLKECIANDIYAYYGIPTARLAIASLPCSYRTLDNVRNYLEEDGLRTATHLMSRWLDRFNTYPYRPDFSSAPNQNNTKGYHIPADDQWVPERGLGHILAVAHFIHDVDVTNAEGKNIGYRLRTDLDGTLYAETCKIDPGYAFHNLDNRDSNAYRVTQSISFYTHQRQDQYFPFDHFPRTTQAEFLETMQEIIRTPRAILERFVQRTTMTVPGLEQFKRDTVHLLSVRQAGLKTAFARELAAYRERTQPFVNPHSSSTLAPELQPLYAQAQLAKTNPIYRQAQHFYIEPDTTLTGNAEEKSQPFSSMLQAFLSEQNAKTLLLLGDSGLGKSTATEQLNQQSWERFIAKPTRANRIPIRIELKQFTSLTVKRCVENTLLDDYHLSPAQINILKQRPCLIILDGFDEIGGRAKCNLWQTNQLSQWKDVRLMVTCRGTYLNDSEIREYFGFGQRNNGLMKRYLSPFNAMQITTYLQKTLAHQQPADMLKDSPQLVDLLQIPLMLKIFVDAFPRLQAEATDLTHLNRFTLYQAFMQEWFERNRARLSQNLSTIISESICERFLMYSEDLAFELFKAKHIEVDYAPGQAPWDRFFSQLDEDSIQLRSGCPLKRVGNQYSFIHKSFFEFFVAQKILRQAKVSLNAQNSEAIQTPTIQPLMDVLMARPLTEEEHILNFLHEATQVKQLPEALIPFLFAIIQHSVTVPDIAPASSNAATILNVCEVPLTYKKWAGVQLPGADLSYCALARSDLRGANLRGANLTHCMLHQVNLTNADLREVQWGEYPWLQMEEKVIAIAHHPTQPWIAITQGNTLVIKNSDTDTLIGQPMVGHTDSVTRVAFSRDGTKLVSGSEDKTVRVWNVQTQKPIGQAMVGHTNRVTCVAFNHDSTRVVSGSHDKTLRLWDAHTQKPMSQLMTEHTSQVISVAFSSDGTKIASGNCDNSVRLWDARTQKAIGQPMVSHSSFINSINFNHGCGIGIVFNGDGSIAFNHDGTRIVSGSHDNTVCLWDSHTQKLIGQPMLGHTGGVTSVAFNHDGTQIASGSHDNTVRLWDPHTQKPIGQPMMGHTSFVTSVAFSSDGTKIVSGSWDRTVRFWDLQTQNPFRQLRAKHSDSINCVAFSPDGTQAVSGSSDHTLRLWDLQTQQHIGQPMVGHTDQVTSVAFNHDGSEIVSGSRDNTVRLWNPQTQKRIGQQPMTGTGPPGLIWSVAFNHNGTQAVLGSSNQIMWLLDTQTQTLIGQPMTGHTASITSVAFSPDGTQIVSGSLDKTLRLWDPKTQKPMGQPITARFSINNLAFSPDGTKIISGGLNTLHVWDMSSILTTGHRPEIIFLTWHQHISSFAFAACSPQQVVNSILNEEKSRHTFLDSRNTNAPSKKEDLLVIGDRAGAISFWAVSYKPRPQLRFLGMPKHPSMPLSVSKAKFLNCQMSATSCRLLKQHGANVTGVRVVNETEQTVEEKVSATSEQKCSIWLPSSSNPDRAMPSSPYTASSSTFFMTTSSSPATTPVSSTSTATTQTTISLSLEHSPAKMALGSQVITLIDALAAYLSTIQQQTPAENLSQAITYASTAVRALGKGAAEYQNVLTNPENYCIPPTVKDFIAAYIHDHGLEALMEHPDFARSLSIQLSYAAQTPPPVGKKDFTALRAEYAARRRSLSPARFPALFADEDKPPTSSTSVVAPRTSMQFNSTNTS